jgi:hypothetical protein
MINLQDGSLQLSGARLAPFSSLRDIEAAVAGACKRTMESGEWVTLLVPHAMIDGLAFVSALYFRDGLLAMVSLRSSLKGEGDSWNDWSEAFERTVQAAHDKLLIEIVGSTSATFPWGRIESVYEAKSGSSDIWINYAWPARPAD